MAHTPGPWEIGPEDWLISQSHGYGYRNFPVRAPTGYDVAMVYSDEDDREQAANAHLIAAAPELLSAMRGSLAFLEWASDWRERDATAVDQEIAFEIGRITRAIAKAEGRSE